MAESKFRKGVYCSCLNLVWKFLEDNLINQDVIDKLSKLDKGAKKECVSEPVSVMYTGGIIRPLKGGTVDVVVQAIGFHNGKVVAAGSKDEVVARMDSLSGNYATIELSKGQTLLPGLIEPHVHVVPTAAMAGWNDFGPFNEQELRDKYDSKWLKEKIEIAKGLLKPDFWILGNGVDPSLMPFTIKENSLNVLQNFNCDTVDEMENDVPVMMMSASGHTAYVNTRALEIIYSKEKQGDSFEDYRSKVNSNGGLQELVEIEAALKAIPILQLLNSFWRINKYLDSMFELANRRGVTLLYDAAMTPMSKIILDIFTPSNVRIGYSELCNSVDKANRLDPYKPPDKFQNIYRGGIKVVSDGSNQGLTGYQFETYCCDPADNSGIFNFDVKDFNEMMKIIIRDKKWPVMIHANGNRAIENTLTAYKEALDGKSGLIKRHRIEHCSLLSEEAIKSMSDLGISPSFLIGHVGYWGYVFKNAIFEDKAQLLDRCQSALSKGMRITLHTDYFVSPLGPLRLMEQAITRIMEQDPVRKVLNEDEKITPAQALSAVTYDAAWQCHADKWVGSLEEGKLADYVILAEDPITRKDSVGMRNIPVLETWVGGIKMGSLIWSVN